VNIHKKYQNKGAGKPSTYFEGSGKKKSPNVELIESNRQKKKKKISQSKFYFSIFKKTGLL
jgi:hypothetical protein